MHVIATAGHVDHGKSTLVRAMTGMEPDRWAEERRRGMTIDLGFAWTTLPGGETVAFVDVPGHERFVPNMLAGVGPVPAALLVVSAVEGWKPQTSEHVAALDALGVRHGVVAVTRSDLADPGPVLADVARRLGPTSLAGVPAVAVSGRTGTGLPGLLAALDRLVGRLPVADADAPVRLWIDRAFTIRGSGTVVTGTLGAGSLRTDDELVLLAAHDQKGGRGVRVRELQALGEPVTLLRPVARAAVNLRGVERADVARGDVLLSPGAWTTARTVDVRLRPAVPRLPAELVLHIGSAAVGARVRLLAGGPAARLALSRPLPLVVGDVALLRDPGRHLIAAAVTVLEADPPPLTRRGAAAARARELAEPVDAGEVLRREHALADGWRAAIEVVVAEHRLAAPLEPGPTIELVRRRIGAPDRAAVIELVEATLGGALAVRAGRIVDTTAALPPAVARATAILVEDLTRRPFDAPGAERLRELGLGVRELAAAERAGVLLRIAGGVVLLPDAANRAAQHLSDIEQPFTLSQARQRLGTSRRVAVPLLELLDRQRLTRRLPDDRRVLIDAT